MASTTQTLSQVKSQEFIGHMKKHFITSPLKYINGIQRYVTGWVHLIDLTTFYLVHYNLHTVNQIHIEQVQSPDWRSF